MPQELIVHPFWQVKLPLVPMPAEPVFDAFVAKYKLAPIGPEEQMLNSSVREPKGESKCFFRRVFKQEVARWDAYG